MKPQNRLALLLLAYMVIILLLYPTLHEAGHALTALMFGASITEFDIGLFSAHVGVAGTFTPIENSIHLLAGVGLPVLVFTAWLIVSARVENMRLQLFNLFFGMAVLNSLLAWVGIPFVYMANSAPPGDDVTRFLDVSGVPPLLLAGAALLLYAVGMVWLFKATRATRLPAALRAGEI